MKTEVSCTSWDWSFEVGEVSEQSKVNMRPKP
jgi:hypothetical protein